MEARSLIRSKQVRVEVGEDSEVFESHREALLSPSEIEAGWRISSFIIRRHSDSLVEVLFHIVVPPEGATVTPLDLEDM